VKPTTFAQCMDVFDWFDDPAYEYLYHIWVSKLDAKARIAHALPNLLQQTAPLIVAHAGQEGAYPVELLNQPA
jgi:hypothetical protein